ncbi:MAG: DUF2905 domain-containing protein [candidate division KSB1 bacterium]|nr:DUF2905 domain-containing protein [candidate division KSB1 bacterium]MDZ7413565.1 DUF2905 domain-containing protein [candidate division KSB1 bacterium]
MDLQPVARILIVVGLLLAGVGVVLLLFKQLPLLGRLPGDVVVQRKHFTFYFPVTTCIVLSLLLTLILYLFARR